MTTGRCPSGRAAAADAVEPSFTVSSKADIPNAGSMRFLLTMVETDIRREGETASFMVRVGLLRDILQFAIGQASVIEARRAAATKIDAVHESAVAESQTPNNSRTTP